ncbi:MAG: hypothetical protein JWQ11_3183 [Rhizobacter sp.]|nr:hypothetical protein [Rhizobacter sp.]
MIWGIVGLLVVLTFVGMISKRQMQAVTGANSAVMAPAASGASQAAAGNVAESAKRLEDKTRSDVEAALKAGAARNDAASP